MKKPNQSQTITCTLLLLWLTLISPPTARADIYSWTDANGVRHFSNKAPRGNVASARRSREIAYDAAADERNQEAERRFFEQRAVQNTLRRLEKTERALKKSLDRVREAESRADKWSSPYTDDTGYDDDPYNWGTHDGGYYGAYDRDRSRRGERDRRIGHRRHRRGKHDRDDAWKRGRHNDDSKAARIRRHKRIGRQRLSKRERGVRSGLTRVVRAVPSPYYMGYRPVYSGSSSASYESRRGGHGRRAFRRGGGGFRGGGRARVGF